jgi:hypothetical protein
MTPRLSQADWAVMHQQHATPTKLTIPWVCVLKVLERKVATPERSTTLFARSAFDPTLARGLCACKSSQPTSNAYNSLCASRQRAAAASCHHQLLKDSNCSNCSNTRHTAVCTLAAAQPGTHYEGLVPSQQQLSRPHCHAGPSPSTQQHMHARLQASQDCVSSCSL